MDSLPRWHHFLLLNCIIQPEAGDQPFALQPGLLGQRRLLTGAQEVSDPWGQCGLYLTSVLGDCFLPAGNILGMLLTLLIRIRNKLIYIKKDKENI